MVEVFKTNVQHRKQASDLVNSLLREFPDFKINVDLADCDKILRIESDKNVESCVITDYVKQKGIDIEVLPD
jgi:hypothetical protein